jgi:ABC-type transport system substrate-binding protein
MAASRSGSKAQRKTPAIAPGFYRSFTICRLFARHVKSGQERQAMKNTTTTPKKPAPARAAKVASKPLSPDVQAFAKHMRTWWKAFDPEQAAAILKNMGIKA